MAPPKVTCVHANWHDIAQVLGLHCQSKALPVSLACPLCHSKGQLSIYQDSISGGAWHYCFSCKHRGDMVDLAASFWNMPYMDTLHRLGREGVYIPEQLFATEARVSKQADLRLFQQSFTDFWHTAQQKLISGKSDSTLPVQRHFGLLDQLSRSRQMNGIAQLYGLAPASTVINLLMPYAKNPKDYKTCPLRGSGWKDVLVVPFYSAPHRFSGMYVVGRNGVAQDRVMCTIPQPTDKKSSREAGIGGFNALIDNPSPFVIAIDDPMTMLKLQVRNFRSSLNPLPLVSWYSGTAGETNTAWNAIGPRRLIFWSLKMTPQVLIQCYRTDAQLVIHGPRTDTPRAKILYYRNRQARDWMRHISEEAKPWRHAVSNWLLRSPELEASKLAAGLVSLGYDPQEVLRGCASSSSMQRKYLAPLVRSVRINKTATITERNGQWFHGDRLFMNGTVQIDQIVVRDGNHEHQGKLRIKDTCIPFRANDTDTDKTVLQKLTQAALEHKQPLYYERTFDVIKVAKAFSTPDIVQGNSFVGWDDKSFHFKQFKMKGGEIEQTDPNLYPDDCPGPADYPIRPIRLPSNIGKGGIEKEVGWALLVSLISSILGSVANDGGPRTLLVTPEAESQVNAFLARCGVAERRLSPDERGVLGIKGGWNHRWPVSVIGKHDEMALPLFNWLLSSPATGIVYQTDIFSALTAMRFCRATTVHCSEFLNPQKLSGIPWDRALWAYLRDYTHRLAFKSPPTWNEVYQDVLKWFSKFGRKDYALRNCVKWIRQGTDPDYVQALAAALYCRGHFRTSGKTNSEGIVVKFDNEGFYTTSRQVATAAKMPGLYVPDFPVDDVPFLVTREMVTRAQSGPRNTYAKRCSS